MSTPIETVWPVGIVFAAWLAVMWRLRGEARCSVAMVVVGAVALAVRCVWIPAWTGHVFDGHEAEYWDLFRGMKAPTRGGTVMVPAMQWFWWGLGQVLPESERVVVGLMAAVGVASIGLSAGAIGRLAGERAGWIAGLLLVVHGAHAAWSSSAYNVMLPHFFSAVALYGAASSIRGHRGPWRSLVVLSVALSMALRMDTGTIGLAVALLILLVRTDGASVLGRLREWWLPGLACVVLTAACIWPMVWPGALPGSGERALSFSTNALFVAPYHPYNQPLMAAALAAAALFALRRHSPVAVALLFWVGAHHGLMATFDDFGERHALVTAPAIAGLAGMGLSAMGPIGWVVTAAMIGLSGADLGDTAGRYYGSEDRFVAKLGAEPYGSLPRVEWTGSPPDDCGWVAEDQRVAARPIASHFNLLRPEEAAQLRGSDGCLKWCVDVQDWRWSSRGVRDRALRLAHLFVLTPTAVVVDSSTGYACLSVDVGHRKRSGIWLNDETHPTAPRSPIALP
ncbi:MAG: hypothetical protein VX944_03760 [Myxococcota bacterium]|nr:hypothetical protein [Myxococcota bacterium]